MSRRKSVRRNPITVSILALILLIGSLVVYGEEGTATPVPTPSETPTALATPLPTEGVLSTEAPTSVPTETTAPTVEETVTELPTAETTETPIVESTAEPTPIVEATPEVTEIPKTDVLSNETAEPSQTEATPEPTASSSNVVTAIFSFTGDETYDAALGGWNVCFTDESSGTITSWAWDFSDTTTSIEQSPCHLYTSAGAYNVTLSVVGGNATSSAVEVISLLQQEPAPIAAYASSDTSVYINEVVEFYDRSTGTIDSWSWDFGDGATSTDRNPSHSYTALGSYTVTLTVSGIGGSATASTTTINVIERPIATLTCDFSAPNIFEDTQVTLDGRVNNAPVGATLSYEWLINGTSVSTNEDLTYTFNDAGSYTVTFTVTASTGENCSRTRTLTVKSTQGAFARFNRTPASGAVGTSVAFTDLSTGSVVSWAWDFGDGSTSTEQNPAHVYNTAGNYTATLTITAGDGSTSSATARVTIHAPQSLSISATPLTGIAPLSVNLTAIYENLNPNTLEWTFPNGTKAYGANATYIFRTGGQYDIRVQGSGALGLITATQTFRIGSLSNIRASFVPDQWTGTAPIRICFTDQSAGESLNSWLWDSGDGQTSTQQNPCFRYENGGTFTVTLTVGNEYGLSATASNKITVTGVAVTETPSEAPTETATQDVKIDVFDPSLSKIGYLPAGSIGLPGEELIWEVTVTNNGGAPVGDTIITDTLRSELLVKSVNTPVGSSSINGQLVTVTIPPSALQNNGDSVTFTILTEVLFTPFNNRIDNTAEIQGEGIQASAEVEVDGGFVIARAAPPLPSGPIPQIVDTTQNTGFAGISQCMTVGFINQGTNPGFGPYFTIVLEQGTDGLTLDSLSFLGTNLLSGSFLIAQGIVPAGSWVAPNDPIEGRPIPQPPAYQSTHNYIWYTVRLPVGSVVTNGPVLDIEACYQVGPLAEIEAPYTIDFYPGYEFGDSATGVGGPDGLDEPISNLDDRANPNPAASDNHGTFTPVLVTLAKSNTLPESEVPPSCYPNTGAIANPANACPGGGAGRPQWPYEYTINIELAPGQTIHNLTFVDTLDSQFQLYPFSAPALPTLASQIVRTNNPASTCTLGTQSVTLNGASPFPYTPISPATAGGTLGINFTSVTNPSSVTTCVVNMTYRGFVIDILGESGPPNVDSIFNEVDFNYDWPTPGTPRTQLTANNTVDVRNQLFQKSANPTFVQPDDVVTYTIEFQVSEYTGIQTLTLVDTIPDGLDLNNGSVSVTVPGVGTAAINGANLSEVCGVETCTLTFNVTGALPGPYPLGGTGTITYTATVLQEYRAGGTLTGFISANDSMTNTLVGNFTTTDGGSFTDDTSASVAVGPNTLTKDLVSTPTDASTGFVPGEPVTFRLVFDIPSGDTRNVVIEDFFPLPVFDVADPDFGLRSTGIYTSTTVPSGGGESFELITGSTPLGYCASYPNATFPAYANSCGIRIVYGAGNTNLPAGSDFTVTVDAATNSVQVAVDADIVTNVTVGRRVVLEFTAAVIDQPFNDNLFLSNLARTTYTDSLNNSVNVDAIDYLTIAGPDVQLCKGIESTTNPSSTLAAGAACGVVGAANNNLTNADAGDQIVYAITIQNVGGARAYNVQVDDNIFSNVNPATSNPVLNTRINSCTLLTVRDGSGTDIAPANYTVTGATPFSRIQFAGSIPGDRSAGVTTAQATRIIRYSCTVSGTVTPGEAALVNTARTRFSPFDDTLPNGTHINPLTGIFPDRVDTASVTPRPPTLTKTRVPATATIGDVVTYTLTLTLPGGTLTNATIVDTLDTGLAFVDCTGFSVSSPSSTVTSTNGTLDLATFCNDGTGVGNNPRITGSGGVATWNFGTLANTGTTTNNPAVITITYTAVVLNVTGNVRGTNLNNSAALSWDNPVGGRLNVTASALDTTVIEPTLQVAKAQRVGLAGGFAATDITNSDANDTIGYRLRITHAAGSDATAFDITMTDTIPTGMTYIAASISVTNNNGATCLASESGGVITVTATTIPYAAVNAGNCDVFFNVTLDNNVEPRQTLSNRIPVRTDAGSLRWTSLAGTPVGRDIYNVAGVERTGAGGATAPNNYSATSGVVNVVIPDPTVNKIITATSEATTGVTQHTAGVNDLTIGETVTYQITYTFREGVTDAVFLRDVLPTTGVVFDYVSSRIVSIGGSLTTTNPIAVGDVGTYPVAPNTVEWNLGNVTTPGNNVAGDSTIVVEVVAQVTNNVFNVGNNPGADVNAQNTGRIDYLDFGDNPRFAQETEPVDIVEPNIVITKTANPLTGDAGDTITYTIDLLNTGTAPAFNVTVSDDLSDPTASLPFVDDSATTPICSAVPAAATTCTYVSPNLNVVYDSILPGVANRRTITYTVVLLSTVPASGEILNVAEVESNSLPDGTGRVYNDDDDATVTVTAPILDKRIVGTSFAPTTPDNSAVALPNNSSVFLTQGETATYEFIVTVPEGNTNKLVLTDTLPAGVTYVSSRVMSIGGNTTIGAVSGGNITRPVGSLAVGDLCTFTPLPLPSIVTCDFDDITNPPAAGADTIVVQVTTRILNTNAAGAALTNTGRVTYTGAPPTPITDTETVRVVAPNLQIVKSFNPAITFTGGIVELRLVVTNLGTPDCLPGTNTSTAYNVNVLDQETGVMDSRYELLVGTIATILPTGTVQTANGSLPGFGTSRLNLTFNDLDCGETITITANVRVNSALSPSNVTIPNEAGTSGDSLPTTSPDYPNRGTVTDNDDEPLIVQPRLSGKVWRDDNRDGSTSQIGPNPIDEKPFNGVTVGLYTNPACTTLYTNPFLTNPTTTITSGDYGFGPVPNGTYYICVTPPVGYDPTFDVDLPFPGIVTPNVSQVVVFDQDRINLDFGYVSQASLGDRVWLDTNGNTLQDVGEVGVPGRTITLTGTDSLGFSITRTTTTGVNGIYTFVDLPPSTGEYTITVTNPPLGTIQTYDLNGIATAHQTGATLAPSQDRVDVDFGYRPNASIGDRIWEDLDADGVQDGGELGIVGVTVTLTGTDAFGNPVSLTQVTIANGIYNFPNLAPSDATGYTVTVTPPPGLTVTYDRDGTTVTPDDNTVIVLNPNEVVTDADFGYVSDASLGDRVWLDADADGVQDVGELGLVGLTVTLTGTDIFGNPVSRTTTTGANGIYNFGNLTPSNATGYTVTVTPPAGLRPTYNWDAEVGNTATPDNINTGIQLAAAEAEDESDFGYVGNSSLGDRVWADFDGDGAQDVGEPGLVGITVTLTGTDSLGNAVSLNTTTGANGIYTFANLVPSNGAGYTVTVTPPPGSAQTYDLNGVGTANTTPAVVTASGANQNRTDVDFGYRGNSSIGDRLWLDNDADGVQDVGEPGMSGVTVTLTGTDTFGNPVNLSTTTGANGIYNFPNLFPSDATGYTVTVTPPSGISNTFDRDGTILTPNNDTTIVLPPATAITDADFGYRGTGSIGDRVWRDVNNDGVQDVGELGIDGRTVTLTGTDAFGNAITRTLTTATVGPNDGFYLFENLPPSNAAGYRITVSQPPGLSPTYDLDGVASPNLAIVPFTLGGTRTDVDFGYNNIGFISGNVWRDDNNSATKNGVEPNLAGIRVDLLGTDVDGNVVNLTTTTDANGNYVFPNLNGGSYTVRVVPPPGMENTYDNNTGKNNDTPVNLPVGGSRINVNFGYRGLGSLGDRVWLDLNGDTVQDVGEPGIIGRIITLVGTDQNGATVNLTTTTGVNGVYNFPNLPPSDAAGYTVTVTNPPAGVTPTYDADGNVTGASVNVANGMVITPTNPGLNRTDVDFGYVGGGSIGDTVWLDTDADGVLDAGEIGLPGLTVTLTGTNSLGQAVTLTQTTDVNGNYLFSGLLAPNVTGYRVTVTPPAGVVQTFDDDGIATPNTSSGVNFNVTNTVLDQDFGYRGNSSIGDRVWEDRDGDRIQDVGEPGINGLLVTLSGTDSLGNAITLTTTTAGDGNYSFPNLLPGTYTVTVASPSGLIVTHDREGSPTPDNTTTVILPANTNVVNADFGYRGTAALGDRVWEDRDGDGVQDSGEPGFNGLTVTLTGTDANGNTVNRTTTTANVSGIDGVYNFTNLPPSNATGYVVTVTPPTGFVPTYDLDGTGTQNTTIATLNGGQTRLDVDFGYRGNSSISGIVWRNDDGDGVVDGGEPRLSSVTVTLTGTDINGNPVTFNTTTDPTGNYNFPNLPPGNYTVTVPVPPGTPNFDTDGVGTPNVISVTLPANTNVIDRNLGYIGSGILGDRVWLDRDGDGIQDGDEPGVAGILVTLTGIDNLGNAVNLTDTTDTNGNYLFTSLPTSGAGGYTVTIATPAGYVNTDDLDATPNGTTNLATFSSTETRLDVDFGIRGNGSVGDRVWMDINGDTVQDAGEPGIPGLTMRLTGTDILGNTYNLTTTTAANGIYTFPNMPPSAFGGYTVRVVTLPTGVTPTFDFDGVIIGVSANVANNVVVTDSGVNQNRTDVDFGYRPTSSVAGTLWRDDNNNERINTGEPDMGAGITVTLTGTDAFGNAISISTTTDASGNYLFEGVPPSGGTGYTITVPTPPVGYVNTFDGLKNTDDTGKNNNIPNVVVNPGEQRTGLDFGYRGTGSIGNDVWLDIDADGIRDAGEPGISGRTVTLTGVDDLGLSVSLTTTTDSNGNYTFPNLPPSATGYTVTVTNPIVGTTQTYDLDGIGTANTALATLTAGQNRTDVDFGYRGSASLGDRVWIDFTNDGIQDAFEPGQNGVTVTLTGTDINGNVVNISTVTANVAGIDGVYNFPNLLPSNTTGYTVTLTAGVPAGLLVGTELDNGAVNRANPNGSSTNNTLASNQNRVDVDFGLIGNASIAGKVWRDDDGNGADNTEPNFRGVIVSLVWNGNVIATRTTNAAGEYLFDNLPPDNYTVVIDRTNPANERLDGFTQTFDADGIGTPDVIAVTLPANTDIVTRDFGYRGTGSIGDLVWQDVSNNRVYDVGVDVVLPNITLRLTGTDEYGNPISVTDITDVNGNYLFENLPRGNYTVTVIGPVLDPVTNQVLTNTADPDGGVRGVGRVILDLDPLLGRVEDILTMDFGYRFVPPPPPLPTPAPGGGGGGGSNPTPTPVPTQLPPTGGGTGPLDLPTLQVPVITANVAGFGGFPFINSATGDPLAARPLGVAPAGDDVPASNGVTINACSTECVDFEFYHTNRTGNWEIYRLGDYRDQTDANPNISQGEGEGINDVAPSRSPNAEWVAFASNRDGNWEIYVAPTNGLTSDIRRVTTNSIAIDTNPVWGPNNQVLYETTRNGNWDLYMVDMVTGDSVALITSRGNDINADWSPDGTKIVFQSDRYGIWQLYELDLQTRTIRLLSDGEGNDVDAQYDNSGGRILFRSDRDGKNAIYTMNRSKTNLKRISNVRGDAANATWSPNDGLIAYQSDLDGDLDIYVYGVANEQTRKLTENEVADFAPSWKCGTDDLFFTSDAADSPDIYQVSVLPLTDPALDVLEDAERLTDDAADDVYPMGAPSNETASREGILAGVEMLMGAQTDFLEPDTTVTPRDTNIVENTDWEAVVGCTSKVCQPWNVYLSNPDDVWNIFRLDGADSAVNLSNGERNDYSPSLSPDKRFIAFTSVRDGDAELFVVTTDGSGELKKLTSNLFVDDNPVWALDGQYLVYESAPFGNFDLYRRDLTTGITQRITSNTANERNPFMSFGNGAVIFNSDRDGQQQLYELTFATGVETRLSDGTANDMSPIYAYDGGKVLFSSDRDGDNALFIMERDGSDVTRISPDDADARNGAWSLDSQFIAFQADVAGDSDIFVYEVATGETRQVTDNDAEDTTPAWRCDTGDLLITSDIMGNPDIFEIAPLPIDAPALDLMTDAEQLTSSEDDDTFPLGSTDEVGSREEISD